MKPTHTHVVRCGRRGLAAWAMVLAAALPAGGAEPPTATQPAAATQASAATRASAATQATATAPTSQPVLITFNFKDAPYTDVIEWFSKKAGLPVIGEAAPKGKLTFYTTEQYTIEEGLKLLNTILMTQKMALVRTPRFYWLTGLGNIADDGVVYEDLAAIPPAAARVTFRYDVKHMPAGKLAEQLKGMVNKETGSIHAFDSANMLIITERPAVLRALVEILQRTDTSRAVAETSLRRFKLRYARASEAAAVLDKLLASELRGRHVVVMPQGQMPKSLEEPPARVAADDRTNSLLVSASPERLAMVEQALEVIDADPASLGDKSVSVRILQVEHDSAEAVARLVTQATGLGGPGAATRLAADPRTNRLIVSGPAGDLNKLEDFLKKLDTPRAQVVSDMKSFKLKHARPEELARTLTVMLSQTQVQGRGLLPPRCAPDERTGTVFVFGTQTDLAAAEKLIALLDVPVDEMTGTAQIKIYQIEPEQIRAVSTTLQKLFPPSGKVRMQFEGNERLGVLIVRGPSEGFKQVEELIDRFRTPEDKQGDSLRAEVKTFALKNARAAEVVKVILQTFPPTARATRFGPEPPPLTATAVERTNTVVVSGPRGLMPSVAELIDAMDASAGPGQAVLTIKTFQAPPAQVESLREAIERLYSDDERRQQGIQVSADRLGGVLIVRAPQEPMAAIEALVAQLVGKEAATGLAGLEVKVIGLKHADPRDVAEAVTRIYADQPWGGVRAVADARLNAVIVSAPKGGLKAVEAMVQEIDRRGEAGDGDVVSIHVVPLGGNEGKRVIEALEKHFPADRQRPGRQVVMSHDPYTNQLIITASESQFKKMQEVIAKIAPPGAPGDASDPSTYTTKVFPIAHIAAATVQSTLASLYTDLAVTYATDPRGNLLIARGSQEALGKIAEYLKTLDLAAKPEEIVTQVIAIEKTEAARVANQLQQIANRTYPETLTRKPPTIQGDNGQKRIVVTGSADQVKLIAQLASQLDVADPIPHVSFRVFRIARGQPSLVVQTLQEHADALFGKSGRPTILQADQTSGQLLVMGTEEQFEKMEAFIRKFAEETASAMQFIQVKHARAAELAETIKAMLPTLYGSQAPYVTLTANEKLNSLVLAGRADLMREVVGLIEHFDVKVDRAPAALRVLPVTRGEAGQVARDVQQIYQRLFPPSAGEVEPLIQADASNRQLLVVGTPEQFNRIESLVHSAKASEAAELRPLRLEHVRAAEVRARVQSLLAAMHPGAAIDVQEHPTGNALLVMAPPALLADVEKLVKAIDLPGSPADVQLKLIPCAEADVRRLSEELRATYARLHPAGPAEPAPGIEPDVARGRLRVLGTPEQIARIEKLLPELTAAVQPPTIQLKFIEVKHAEAAGLAQDVTQLYGRLYAEESDPRPSIEVDASGVRLRVIATNRQMPRIEELVAKLDVKAAPPGLTMKLVAVPQVDLTRLAQDLTQTCARLYPPPAGRPAPSITVDAKSGQLRLLGTAEQIKQIEELIPTLAPAASQPALTLRLVPVTAPDVATLAQHLSALYRQLHPEADGRPQPAIEPDAARQQLRIVATADQHKELADLIAQLETDARTQQIEMKLVTVKQADPAELARLVQETYAKLYPPRPGASSPVVQADGQTGRLRVFAAAADMDKLTKLITDLDAAPARQNQAMRVFPIVVADPVDLAAQVEEAFRQLSPPQPGQPAPLIQGDRTSRQLRVIGTEEQLKVLELIIKQFDAAGRSEGQVQMKTIAVKQAQPSVLAQTFERVYAQLYPTRSKVLKPTIMPDDAGRRLRLFADPATLELVLPLLEQLDVGPEMPKVEVRSYRLASGNAFSVARGLQENLAAAYPPGSGEYQPIVRGDQRGDRLFVTATTEQFKTIEPMLSKLEKIDRTQVRSFEIKHGRTSELASMVQHLYSMQRGTDAVRATPHPSTNVLYVAAPEEDMEEIARMIERLDVPGKDQDFQIRTYRLSTRHPQVVLQALQTQSQRLYGAGGQTPPTIQHDYNTNQLIVMATEAQLKKVEEVIDQFGQADRFELKVVVLKQAKADDLARTLQQMSASLYGGAASNVSITANPADNSLILSAPRNLMADLDRLIQHFDAPRPSAGVELRLIKVDVPDPAALATQLQALDQRLHQERPGVQPPVIQAMPAAGQLMIAATAEQHQRLQPLVAQLSAAASQPTPQMKVLTVTNARPSDVARTLTQIHSQMYPAPADAPRPALTPDDERGQIRVVAAPRQLREIEELLQALEKSAPAARVQLVTLTPKKADSHALAQAVSNAYSRLYPAVAGVPPPQLEVDARTGQIRLFATEEQLQRVQALVNLFDVEPGAARIELRTLKPKARDLADLASRLRSAYSRLHPPQAGQADPQFEPDLASGKLHVYANAEQHERIATLLAQLDTAEESGDVQMRIYAVQDRDPGELAGQLQEALRQVLPPRPGERPPLLQGDAASGQLRVFATADQLKVIEPMVAQFKLVSDTGQLQMKVYAVKHVNPYELISQVQAAFQKLHPAQARLGLPTFLPDPTGNRVRILATPAVLKLVEPLLESIDAAPPQPKMQMKTFKMQRGNAARTASLLEQSFRQLFPLKRGEEAPMIRGEPTTQTLFVTATEEQLKVIEPLIRTFEEAEKGAVKSFEVTHVEPWRLAGMLQSLFALRHPGTSLQAVPQDQTQSLFVAVPEQYLPDVEELVKMLDVPPTTPRVELREFAVQEADPSQLAATVRESYAQLYPRRVGEPAPSIAADPVGRTLRVFATARQLKELEEVIKRFDVPPPRLGLELKTVAVQQADPHELAAVVRNAYQYLHPDKPGTPPPIIEVLAAARQLRVFATPEQHAKLQKLFTQFDVAPQQVAQQLKVYDLIHAPAWSVVGDLNEAFLRSGRYRPGDPPPQFRADASGRQVKVLATAEQLPVIDQLVAQLDVEPAQVRQVIRTVEVKEADAAQVASLVLNTYVRLHPPTSGRPAPAIQGDTAQRRIQIIATEEQVEKIEALVRTFDVKPPRAPVAMKAVPVRETAPSQIQHLVLNSYRRLHADPPGVPEPVVEADDPGQALRVFATPEQFPKIEALVQQFDVAPARAQIQMRVFQARQAEVYQLANQVMTTYNRLYPEKPGVPRPAIEPDRATGQLRVFAVADQFPAVEELIRQLDVPPEPPAQTEVRTYQLTTGNAWYASRTLAAGLARLLPARPGQPSPQVEPDPSRNQIVVTATPDQFKPIEELIEKLGITEETTLRTLTLKHVRASQIQGSLQNLFQQEHPGATLHLVPHKEDAALLATVARKHVDSLQRLVDLLDVPPSAEALEIKTLTPRSLSAAQLAADLQSMYGRLYKAAPTERPPVFEVRPDQNAVRVTATPEQWRRIESLAKLVDTAPDRPEVKVRTFAIAHGDPHLIQRLLEGNLTQLVEGTQAVRPTFQADREQGTLTVTATADQLRRIGELVAEMDQAAPDTREQMRTFALKFLRADQAAQMVRSLFYGRRDRAGRQADVRLTVHERDNAVVVSAPGPFLSEIEGLLRQIDVPREGMTGADFEPTVRVVQLGNAQAGTVAAAVQASLQNQRGTGPEGRRVPRLEDVTLSPDPAAGVLVLSGSRWAVDYTEKLVKQVAQEAAIATETRLVALRHAQASRVSSSLNQLFQGQPGYLGASYDTRTNCVIVRAGAAKLADIEKMIADLDRLDLDQMRTVRVVPVHVADPAELAWTLEDMLYDRTKPGAEPPRIRVDTNGRQLVIDATLADHEEIDRLLDKLDPLRSLAGGGLRVVRLRGARAGAVAQMLERMLGERVKIEVRKLDQPAEAMPAAASQPAEP